MSDRELSSVPATDFGSLMRARLVTPTELAEWLAVTPGWVYEHASELGALRLGDGPKARLRFDVEAVKRRLSAASCSEGRRSMSRDAAPEAVKPRRRRRRLGTNVELLPVHGRSGDA